MNKVNYREEDEIVNRPQSCNHLSAACTECLEMVRLISHDVKEI